MMPANGRQLLLISGRWTMIIIRARRDAKRHDAIRRKC